MKISPPLALLRAARHAGGLLLLVLLCLLPLASARATTLVITSTLDDGGAGTLRSQIAAAGEGDIIVFDMVLFAQAQTITLTRGEIGIAKSLSIQGSGASTCTVSGNNAGRIFNIASGTVTIAGLTLSGGRVVGSVGAAGTAGDKNGGPGESVRGGAILNFGSLTLSDVVLDGNQAVAGAGGKGRDGVNDGERTIRYPANEGGTGGRGGNAQGGAIFNGGELWLTNTTLSRNSAQGGAGGEGGKHGRGQTTILSGPYGGNGGDATGGAIYSVAGGIQQRLDLSLVGNGVLAGLGAPTVSLTGPLSGLPGAALALDIFDGSEVVPFAQDLAISTPEDKVVSVALIGGDAQTASASLTRTIVMPPAHGTLKNVASGRGRNGYVYTPATNFFGTDSFTFKVNDGTHDSNIATVTIVVAPVNDAPTLDALSDLPVYIGAAPQSVALQGISAGPGESQTLSITATSSNPAVVPDPAVTYSSPDTTGRLDLRFVGAGTATITVKVQDDGDTSPSGVDTRTRTFVVNVKSAVPVANPDTATTNEDTTLLLDVLANDSGGLTLTSVTPSPQTHGTLTIVDGKVLYMPELNFFGASQWSYTAKDGALSAQAQVTVQVLAVDDAPVAASQNLRIAENMSVDITLGATDAEGADLTYRVYWRPMHGTLSGTGRYLRYTPAPNFIGQDLFSFRASDGALEGEALISVTMTAVNDAPVALDDAASTDEDTSVLIDVLANDTDVDSPNLILASVTPSAATHGTLALEDNKVRYTPAANFDGTANFSYTVSDGALSAQGEVLVQVLAVNDAPVASSQSLSTAESTPLDIALSASDIEGSPLRYSLVAQPQHGTLSGTGAQRRYTPEPNYSGPDSFSFQVNDGTLDSNVATVSITVTAVNDAPVAVDDTASTDEDTSILIDVLANDSDVDSATLAIASVVPNAGTNGRLSIEGNKVRYTPTPDFSGAGSFTYTMSDGALTSRASVLVRVRPVNDPPVARGQELATQQGTALPLTLAAHDVDGDALSYAVVASPAHGTLAGSGAELVYTPEIGFSGVDSFTFAASDGSAASDVATVTIQVAAPPVTPDSTPGLTSTPTPPDSTDPAPTPAPPTTTPDPTATPTPPLPAPDPTQIPAVPTIPTPPSTPVPTAGNRAPVAVADAYTTQIALQVLAARGVLSNDADADGQPLSALLKGGPANGTLTLRADGSFTYRPKAGFWGRDSFTYAASDGHAQSAPAAVTLTILAPPDVTAPAVSITSGAQPLGQRLGLVSGTAPDPGVVRGVRVNASGLASVGVHLRRNGLYWNERSWQGTPFALRTVLGAGGRWQLNAALPTRAQAGDGLYFWTALARDKSGNSSSTTKMVRVDATAPALSISTPAAGRGGAARVLRLASVEGRVSEFAKVEVALRNSSAAYFNGRAFVSAPTFLTATSAGSAWTLRLPTSLTLPAGRYALTVRATDAAGNVGTAQRLVEVASAPAS